jgi:hypothetical protein
MGYNTRGPHEFWSTFYNTPVNTFIETSAFSNRRYLEIF